MKNAPPEGGAFIISLVFLKSAFKIRINVYLLNFIM